MMREVVVVLKLRLKTKINCKELKVRKRSLLMKTIVAIIVVEMAKREISLIKAKVSNKKKIKILRMIRITLRDRS